MDYKSKRWKVKQGRCLRKAGYACQECARYGKRADANTAHHVYPAEEYPGYAWEDWNLIALCATCHNAMHDRTTRELTAEGERWKKKITPPRCWGKRERPPGPEGGRNFPL